ELHEIGFRKNPLTTLRRCKEILNKGIPVNLFFIRAESPVIRFFSNQRFTKCFKISIQNCCNLIVGKLMDIRGFNSFVANLHSRASRILSFNFLEVSGESSEFHYLDSKKREEREAMIVFVTIPIEHSENAQ